MTKQNGLFLHEELMLLALKDTQGTVAPGTMYQYGIGGAILAELLLGGRIRIDESKKKLVGLLDTKPLGEPLVDECLERIATAKRRASAHAWVSRFAATRRLRDRIAQGLCRRGILQADEDKVLLIFTRKVYPQVNPGPERELIMRLEEAIFTETANIGPRTVVLLSLANSAGVLRAVFDKKMLKTRKKRIEQVVNGDVMGKATKEAIEAMQAAVMMACIMPTFMASSTH